jgi:hypothetical protein
MPHMIKFSHVWAIMPLLRSSMATSRPSTFFMSYRLPQIGLGLHSIYKLCGHLDDVVVVIAIVVIVGILWYALGSTSCGSGVLTNVPCRAVCENWTQGRRRWWWFALWRAVERGHLPQN